MRHGLLLRSGTAPPPSVAGLLAAFFRSQGNDVIVLDPVGCPARWQPVDQLWVHREPDDPRPIRPELLVQVLALHGVVDLPPWREMAWPEGEAGDLPITTWAGFGVLRGGALRVAAGPGDRVRPVAHFLREILYAAETYGVGHLLFDDADLAAYPGWLEAMIAASCGLPWSISWDANVGVGRMRGALGVRASATWAPLAVPSTMGP